MKHAYTPCRECRALTQRADGLCEAHKHMGWVRHQEHRAATTHPKDNYGAAWRKLRQRVLFRDQHLCQECLRHDVTRIATEVDHVIAREHGGSDDLSNLQALCRHCHRIKTAHERTRKPA